SPTARRAAAESSTTRTVVCSRIAWLEIGLARWPVSGTALLMDSSPDSKLSTRTPTNDQDTPRSRAEHPEGGETQAVHAARDGSGRINAACRSCDLFDRVEEVIHFLGQPRACNSALRLSRALSSAAGICAGDLPPAWARSGRPPPPPPTTGATCLSQ